MDGHQFDRLTRSWADGGSRRNLLGSALGGALAVALGRTASAKGNSDCAHFCNAVYPPGPARGKCKSDAAKRAPGNLCDACEAEPTRVCTAPSGTKTCCAGDETCVGGGCQSNGCAGDVCDDGVCCDTTLSLACCNPGDGPSTCTALTGDGNCGACGVTCFGQTATIAPDVTISLLCCGDGTGCGIGTTQPCVLGSDAATCCGGDAHCVASTSPFTGRVCCGAGGSQCSSDQPCCDGFTCIDATCVLN